MKDYRATMFFDVRGDGYLNPAPPETRPENAVQKIIVHHDATVRPHDYDSMARYRNEASYHYKTLGAGLQYHIKISNTGEIFLIRPFTATLWQAGDLNINRTSISICLDGYFHAPHNQLPTREQLEALQQTLDWLCTQNPQFPADQNDVFGHREASSTACPGDTMIGFVQEYRNTGKITIPNNIGYDWIELQPTTPPPQPDAPTPTPPSIDIKYRVFKDGKQIGAYTVDTNAWNKYKAESADMIQGSNGQNLTEQFKLKFDPPKPPPAIPEDEEQNKVEDATQKNILEIVSENNTVLKQLLGLIQGLIEWLKNIFK